MVIAETLLQAKDAAELVEVDYEALPSVTSTADAALPDAPRVWDENPDNISHTYERGDKAKTEAAFARARHIARRRYVISRVHAQYMEPRGAIGTYDVGEDRTLYADVNYPHRVRAMLANMVFKVPESKVRVVCHDVGGGFGAKGWQYVEHRLTLWAAKKLGRPVKWSCERSEVILADEHGRDNIGEIELAFDDNAKIPGLRLHMLASIGAYIASDRQLLTPFGMIGTVVGVYDIPAAYISIDAVLSNTSPTAPYRGAGRPEAIYLIERAIEDAARELDLDPIELRRRNIISPAAMPYQTALGPNYDCGDFTKNMETALAAADHAGFAVRREASKRGGMLRGIGLANAIEAAAGPVPEYAEIRFNPGGTAMLLMGTKAHGQGHETAFKQILCERLGLDPNDIQYIDGDTDRVAFGMGSNGSRSMGSRRFGADPGGRQGNRQRKAARGPFARSRRGRSRIRRRQIHGCRHRPQYSADANSADLVPAGAPAIRDGAGTLRERHLCPRTRDFPERLPCLRGRSRPRDWWCHARRLYRRRRCRHGNQPADPEGPGAWRARPGNRPDLDGAGRL
jgi:carbon-monoxide dehydrogenase large subunit